jgi:GNAT superfamily N-acetyltransferase
MIEKRIGNSTIEVILETQEESDEDDEMIFKLFVNERLVSWAKTLLYSFLKDIHTANVEKRKGYGRKLLAHIEKNAKAHGATTMKTSEIDSSNYGAIGFFRSMGYGLRSIEHYGTCFLKEQKNFRKHSYLLGSLETVTFADSPKRLMLD